MTDRRCCMNREELIGFVVGQIDEVRARRPNNNTEIAEAIFSAIQAAGWAVVPLKMTNEMMQGYHAGIRNNRWDEAWQSALAASPAQKETT